jgi:transcriptional regulator with XRE-family HTH domain
MKKYDTIGSRIRAAREERGLSQLDLASALGFQSATAVSLIESNERGVSAEMLQRLGEVLHRDVKYFLGQDESVTDVQVALRADKDISEEDKKALSHFIELAKKRKKNV